MSKFANYEKKRNNLLGVFKKTVQELSTLNADIEKQKENLKKENQNLEAKIAFNNNDCNYLDNVHLQNLKTIDNMEKIFQI